MFPSTQVNASDLRSALQQSQVQQTDQGNGGASFMKFDYKTGAFTFGREGEDISGEEIAVNTSTFKHGWTVWAEGKPHKTAVPFTQELPPQPAAIGDNVAAESRSFQANFTDGDDVVLQFDINSYGGRKGCDALLSEIKAKALTDTEGYLFPVVKLESESYKAKTGGTIFNPVFKVIGWMNQAGEMENQAAQLEAPEPEAAPVKRRRRKA